jgi:hypothetical protein
MQDADGSRFPCGTAVLEGPGHTGNGSKGRPLGQKASELQVQVHAHSDPPKELGDQLIPIDDRGVALLGGQRGGDQRDISRTPEVDERLGRQGTQHPCGPLQLLAVGDGCQQSLAKRLLLPSLAQQSLLICPPHTGEYGLGCSLLHLLGALANDDRQWENIPHQGPHRFIPAHPRFMGILLMSYRRHTARAFLHG